MDAESEHILIALITAMPAIIAAVSSLKNGQEQRRVRRELHEQTGELNASLNKAVAKVSNSTEQSLLAKSDNKAHIKKHENVKKRKSSNGSDFETSPGSES